MGIEPLFQCKHWITSPSHYTSTNCVWLRYSYFGIYMNSLSNLHPNLGIHYSVFQVRWFFRYFRGCLKASLMASMIMIFWFYIFQFLDNLNDKLTQQYADEKVPIPKPDYWWVHFMSISYFFFLYIYNNNDNNNNTFYL